MSKPRRQQGLDAARALPALLYLCLVAGCVTTGTDDAEAPVFPGLGADPAPEMIGMPTEEVDVAPPEPLPPPAAPAIAIPPEEPADIFPAGYDPESARVYFEAAEKFRSLGDIENAVLNYRRALRHAPEHHEASLHLAETLDQAGSRQEAVALLKSLLSQLHYGEDDRELNRIRQSAEKLLREMDELALALSEAAQLLAVFGQTAEDAGRPANALELYTRALDIWPACAAARERANVLCRRHGWDLPSEAEQPSVAESHLALHELTPADVLIRTGPLRKDETRWGLPFYNQGVTYEHGLWAPAPSRLTYELNGSYKRFTAKVLVSAFKGKPQQIEVLERELRRPGAGTVKFFVYADDVKVFESDVVTYASGAQYVDVDVTGAKELVLEATDADGSDLLDFAVWAEGRLHL